MTRRYKRANENTAFAARIGQAKPSITQVPPEEAILFHQTRNHLTLPPIEPANQNGEQLQGQRVNHSYTRSPSRPSGEIAMTEAEREREHRKQEAERERRR